jgi:hypothetical protein
MSMVTPRVRCWIRLRQSLIISDKHQAITLKFPLGGR